MDVVRKATALILDGMFEAIEPKEKVKTLKSQNTELASTASLLREQVAQLKQKVLSHVNSGCQLLPQHQVPAY